MDIKNCIEITTSRGERTYTLHVPSGAPWGELFDAAHEIFSKVSELVSEAVQNAVPQPAQPDTADNATAATPESAPSTAPADAPVEPVDPASQN